MVATESRTKKSFLNARVNLVFYFVSLIISFLSRKVFLDTLGADFIGLTTTLLNLLGFLNLAELGVGTAIAVVLYKPLYDHDEHGINEIISVMGYLYRVIGLIILSAGIVLSLFLPLIFPNQDLFSYKLIYFAYYSFLASSLIGYFINYRQNLLSADQRNYVVTAYFQTANIVKILIQMTLAYYTRSFYLWVFIEFVFGIIYSFILNRKINQTYPWLRTEVNLGKDLLKKYPKVWTLMKQTFYHKLGGFFQYQLSPLLIYSYVSLQSVALYGNYTIVTTKVDGLFKTFLSGMTAGIGNLVVEGNTKKVYEIYWELFAFRMWFSALAIVALSSYLTPFIVLWLGAEYALPQSLVYLMLVNVFINLIRGNTEQYLEAHGLFSDIWAPFVESIIFVVVALIAGYFFGIFGVVLGSTISLIVIIAIWKPYFLFKNAFRKSVFYYWANFMWFVFLAVLTYIPYYYSSSYLCNRIILDNTWMNFIAHLLVGILIYSLMYFVILFIFTKGMKGLVHNVVNYARIKK